MNLDPIPYQIIRSSRRKTAAIKIVEQGVEVRVPSWVDNAWVMDLLKERRQWIETHWDQYQANQSQFQLVISEGALWPYLGETFELSWQSDKKSRVVLSRDRIDVFYSNRLKASEKENVSKVLKTWYQEQAEFYLSRRVEFWADKMGLKYRTLKVKGFRKRWGSCSASAEITLNWRLIMASEPLIDYVIIHELAHLSHFNHSPDFWGLVSDYCSDWKIKRKALNQRSIWLNW